MIIWCSLKLKPIFFFDLFYMIVFIGISSDGRRHILFFIACLFFAWSRINIERSISNDSRFDNRVVFYENVYT
jgi:hypothetical protein